MALERETSEIRSLELCGDAESLLAETEEGETQADQVRRAVILRRSLGAVAGLALIGSAVALASVMRPGTLTQADLVRTQSKYDQYMHAYMAQIANKDVNGMLSKFSPNGILVFKNKGMIETFTTKAEVEVGLKMMYKDVDEKQCVSPEKQSGSSAEHTSILTWGCPGVQFCMFASFNDKDVMHYWDIDKMSVNLDGPCQAGETRDPLRKTEY